MKVSILGLGLIAMNMAGRLHAAGFEVTVWTGSLVKPSTIIGTAVRLAATPADAAAGAAIVLAILTDDDVSRSVWMSESGALAAMAPGSIAIEASTLTSDWIGELATAAAARAIDLLDAPVAGDSDDAAAGQLRFLVGGEAAALEYALPALEAMSMEVVHLGPVGSGAIVKLAETLMTSVQVACLADAVALFEVSGVNASLAVSLLTTGGSASPVAKPVKRRLVNPAYDPRFLPVLMAKNLDYVARILSMAGIKSAVTLGAHQRFLEATAAGETDKDMATVAELLR